MAGALSNPAVFAFNSLACGKGQISLILIGASLAFANSVLPLFGAEFPQREGERPATTDGVPHVQIGHASPPEISEMILSCADSIQGVDVRDTIISLPGTKGFWLGEEMSIENPQSIVRGREFAHMHPGGSLHASLDPDVALTAVETGWAIPHPWSDQRPGWEGFVMIYSPANEAQLEVVVQLIASSYNYVTGKEISIPDC